MTIADVKPDADVDLDAIDQIERDMSESCEFTLGLRCPGCGNFHVRIECGNSADYLVVIRNCNTWDDCKTRGLCTHVICTSCKDLIASGRIFSSSGPVQLVSCEPIKK